MKRFLWYIVPIISALASLFLRIISSTVFMDTLLVKMFDTQIMPRVKGCIEILNYLVFVIPIVIQSILRAKAADRCKEVISNCGRDQRELLFNMLYDKGYITGSCDDINIRVFRKRRHKLVLMDNMRFCSREIKGKLSFSFNNNEGLCSKAYKEKHSAMEFEDASKDKYNLTQRQKALAGGLKFIVAVPIHPASGDSIKTVICFDSFSQIAKDGCEQGILKICEQIAYSVNSIIE